MRIYLTITRQCSLYQTQLPKALLQQVARQTIELAACWQLPKRLELSLLLTDDEGIRKLNLDYRNLDKPTDVLSFPLWESEPPLFARKTTLSLGDIVISLERAALQSTEYEHSITREIVFLFIHGLLHLLGYDHELNFEEERRMIDRQKKIINSLEGLI